MRKHLVLLLLATFASAASTDAQTTANGLVLVKGGIFKNIKSRYFARTVGNASPYVSKPVVIPDFYMGKYEVTQKQWVEVMGSNPSKFSGENNPVEMVNWYDSVEYCNQRSVKEGLKPYYTIDKSVKDSDNENEMDSVKWRVTINEGANGYRLPTEAEWEYAADGGQLSRSYTYPGSNDVEAVAWYYQNSGDKVLTGYWNWPMIERNHNRTQPVGMKKPNEIGLYDMGGNVREWCWNWYAAAPVVGTGPKSSKEGRVWRGGGWMGGDFCCASTWRASYEASGHAPDQGLRVCRDK